MKYILFLLIPFTALGQNFVLQDGTKMYIPEEIWKNAIHVNISTPKEIQFEPGSQVKFIILEVPNGGKTIRISEAGTTTPTEPVLKETVNNTDSRITYTGTWSRYANLHWTDGTGCAECKPFHNKDVSVTYGLNASASLNFTGKKIEVVSEFRENHAFAKIEILQGTTVVETATVDMFRATTVNTPATIFTSKTLPQGTYTCRVSLVNITAGKDSMVFDGFNVYE